jgi:hypothetical protein
MNHVQTKERKEKATLDGQGHDSWQVDVYVYLHSATPGDFTIESYLQSNPNSGKLEFYNRHHPGFSVTFHLIDEQDLGYRFPLAEDKKDGLLSQLGTTCPTIDDPRWEIFSEKSIHIYADGMTLSAFNPNEAPAVGDFQYTLNVSLDGRRPYLPLDPGGTNHNGITFRPSNL